jgi:enoyl-CoA hydratase/carnithine racemase
MTENTQRDCIVRDDGRVRSIALNRPASKNGLTLELNQSVLDALEGAATNAQIRAVVITGNGGAFSSGLDLKVAAGLGAALGEVEQNLDKYFHSLIRAIRRLEKPVIAFVDGPAVGFGCDLALACDLRVGTHRARFGEIFIKRGLMPDGGSTFHLPRLVGLGTAMELLLTGRIVDAEEAGRIGLLNAVVPVETGMQETMALAQRIAAGPPRVHAWLKRAVYGALDGTLEEALATERLGQGQLMRSRDFLEGVSAFLQKREPDFTGE